MVKVTHVIHKSNLPIHISFYVHRMNSDLRADLYSVTRSEFLNYKFLPFMDFQRSHFWIW